MPEMRYYTVTQTREVKIVANNLDDAARLGQAAFQTGVQGKDSTIDIVERPEGVWGNATDHIKELTLFVKRDR